MKKKKFKTYQEFEEDFAKRDKSRIESYVPPEYVIQPAKDDKGFAMLKAEFDDMETIMEPKIRSSK